MKKKDLEMILQSIPSPISTNPQLEQYITPASIASDIIFFAHLNNDILEKKIIDLGCGTGLFAIGAALTGATHTIAIEIDPSLIKIAQKFANSKKLSIQFINDDIKNLNIPSDTIITNPPFGAQKPNKHADRLFLEKAYECAPIIIAIKHNTISMPLLKSAGPWQFSVNFQYDI